MRHLQLLLISSALIASVLLCSPGISLAEDAPAPLENRSIRWTGWGQEAFDSSKETDKLIFLDISANWCRWCKVMDETAYKDPRVIETLNGDFIPVFVNADERPDLSDRYSQGGLPSISLLTPTGMVIAGQTTTSADELLTILNTANASYRTDRAKVYEKIAAAEKAAAAAREERDKKTKYVPLSAEMPVRVLNAINLFVDPKYGGYGGPDKFPMPEVMEFALYIYPKARQYKNQSPETAIELTLDGMKDGIFDKVDGGSFRYSTTQDWKSPHYEKLLTANADMLGIYMHAGQALDTGRYIKAGEAIAGYLERVLYDKETGAFYNSQAADEKYYRLGSSDRRAAKAPPVEKAIFADSNAKAAIGYLQAYRATGQGRYLKVALGVLDYITGRLYRKGVGVFHSNGQVGGSLFLSDQVYSSQAGELAYQATGDEKYLEFAVETAGTLVRKFWDAEKGGFFDTAYDNEPFGLLKDPKKPQIENAAASALFMDLYHITGAEEYKKTARHTLAPFAQDYLKHSYWAAPFALGVERCIETAYEFIVVGKAGDAGTRELIKNSFTFDEPDRVVVPLDPVRDKDRLTVLGYEYEGKAVLYVCSDKVCFPPVSPGDSMKGTRKHIAKAREQDTK